MLKCSKFNPTIKRKALVLNRLRNFYTSTCWSDSKEAVKDDVAAADDDDDACVLCCLWSKEVDSFEPYSRRNILVDSQIGRLRSINLSTI